MDVVNANILVGDVKGYSSLNDQQLFIFASKVLPLAARRVQDYAKLHVNTWGDGIIIATSAIEDIAAIALELRDFFKTFDWEREGLTRLDIRLSVHHGEYHCGKDAFTERGLISGRSVILAARIEPVVQPGDIWITQVAALALQQAHSGRKEPIYAVDEIGMVCLAKGAGDLPISLLRRSSDSGLSEARRKAVLDASNARRRGEATFEACVGVAVKDSQVLLVRRLRNDKGLEWMFPSAKKLPLDDERHVIVKEVFQETGLRCRCIDKITIVDQHPLTGARCHYFHLSPLDDTLPSNNDPEENADARYVAIAEAKELIGDGLTPEIARFLDQAASG